jgi:hypothetical protein
MSDTCIVDGCGKPGRARQMCWTHYKRWQKHGDATVKLAPGRREPRVKGPTLWVVTCGECGATVALVQRPTDGWPYLEAHVCEVAS